MADRNNNLGNSGTSGDPDRSNTESDTLRNQEGLDESEGGMSGSGSDRGSSDRSRTGDSGSGDLSQDISGDELGGSRESGQSGQSGRGSSDSETGSQSDGSTGRSGYSEGPDNIDNR